jgi:hypothetical protein
VCVLAYGHHLPHQRRSHRVIGVCTRACVHVNERGKGGGGLIIVGNMQREGVLLCLQDLGRPEAEAARHPDLTVLFFSRFDPLVRMSLFVGGWVGGWG